ncbi:hypothetical protein ACP4OV_010290 [Aristida adscensionis]
MVTELGALPDDVLADILRRLPAPSLAAAQCVRKAWCAIVDNRELLLPHLLLLPRSVDAIFINCIDHCSASSSSARSNGRQSSARGGANAYLAFDPAVSPHYEVFLIPVVPEKPLLPDRRDEVEDDDDDTCRLMEWPQTPLTLHVFSSR